MSRESDEVKGNIMKLLELELGRAKIAIRQEARSIWKIGDSMRIYLTFSIGRSLSNYMEYFFDFQDSLLGDFMDLYGEYMLFACGYANGMPKKLYRIYARSILDDESIVKSSIRRDKYEVHIEVYHDGRQRIRENGMDIKRDLISVYELPGWLLHLVIQEDMNLEPARYYNIYEYDDPEYADIDRIYEITRGLMDTAEAIKLKELYEWKCQICGSRIHRGSSFDYAEVYRIWPLRYGGPDERTNMLVVCPNHHTELGYGCLKVVTDGAGLRIIHIDSDSEFDDSTLYMNPGHNIDPKNLDYHEKNIWQG